MPLRTFERLIATAGTFRDGDVRAWWGLPKRFTNTDIIQMYRSTSQLMAGGSFRPVVKIGHYDDDQRQKGYVKALRLGRVELPSGRSGYGIWATFVLHDQWARDLEAGYYPNCSIEADDNFLTDDGKRLPWVLDGFALLGTDQPAIPHLGLLYASKQGNIYLGVKNMPKGSLWNKVKQMFAKSSAGSMDIALLEESLAAITQALDLIEAGGDGYDPKPDVAKAREAAEAMQAMLTDWKEAMQESEEAPESEEVEAGKKAEDMEYKRLTQELAQANKRVALTEKKAAEEVQKLRDEIAKEKVDAAFVQLHTAGKVVAEDRDTFNLLAKHQGLDKAIAHFSARPEPMTPDKLPKGLKTADDLDLSAGANKALFQEFFDRATARGLSKEAAEKQARLSVQFQLQKTGGN